LYTTLAIFNIIIIIITNDRLINGDGGYGNGLLAANIGGPVA